MTLKTGIFLYCKYAVALCGAFFLQIVGHGQEKPSRVVSVAELNSRIVEITGRLGLPLGTVVEVEATIVDGSTITRRPDLRWEFVLSVEKVNGKLLAVPTVFNFRVPGMSGGIVSRHDDLPEINGRRSYQKKPTEDELEEMKRRYVGTRYKLALFEIGEVGTHPRILPDDCPTWSDWRDYFQTYVVVLAIR
jgi:hypothetical protein